MSKKDEAKAADAIVKDADKPDQTNPVEESKADGTATTDDGRTVSTSGSVAVPEDAPDVNEEGEENVNAALDIETQQELCGELTANELGYLPLDEFGFITGPAKRGEPPEGQHFARVVKNGDFQKGFAGQVLTTPAGAPITRKMNPDQRKDGDHNRHAKEALENQTNNDGS